MATQDEIDQQRRVVLDHKAGVVELLAVLSRMDIAADTYTRLGLGDDQILDPTAFTGTGTTVAKYRAAMGTIGAIQTLIAQGHGTNLEKFAK